ncbi:AbrB/MazE/SpoVT family DNA-binding domain-containing protein [Candidatus Woesearchaeota archaeon]|nr:AbrB/MazE/SpoVT family DNA-binding domain-containing protein [Candidatus Woesearchaeota archaeon]
MFLKIEKYISKNFLTKFMIIKTVKVSDKGQIAIPLDIRKINGINKGDNLIIIQEKGKILIEKASERIKDDFSDILKISEKSLKEVWDNKEDEVWNQYLKK